MHHHERNSPTICGRMEFMLSVFDMILGIVGQAIFTQHATKSHSQILTRTVSFVKILLFYQFSRDIVTTLHLNSFHQHFCDVICRHKNHACKNLIHFCGNSCSCGWKISQTMMAKFMSKTLDMNFILPQIEGK